MSNIALQLGMLSAGMVMAGGNVLFDTVQYSVGNIDYDIPTGVITFNEAGRYMVNWWVTTQASASTSGPVFTLTSSQGDLFMGNSPVKTGGVYGAGIITVASAPVTVSLVNSSAATFYYAAQVPLRATLMVIQDSVGTNTTMGCFAVDQLVNILSQMIVAYPATTWSVFSSSLASYSGTPLDLYASPNATGPGILRLLDVNNNYEALPIANITALYPGAGTVYDPAFTYLPPPTPLPPGCDTDMIAAIQSYLPIGTAVEIRLGPAIVASGDVYRNEYGVLVLSDASGNTPVFVASPHILRIFTNDDPTLLLTPKGSGTKPSITINKE